MRQLIKYPGSKWSLTDWITSFFPWHHSYLEPFFGSGAVLFNKESSNIDTVKDKILTEKEITRPNNCRDYGYCGMDIITGKIHKAKFRKEKSNDGEQLQIGGTI